MAPAIAGDLDRAGVAKYFPEPYYIGERDTALPVWPLFRHNIPQSDDFLGYVYESIDLAPIAGYSGTPPNLLIAITPEGTFIAVTVVSHNEPIFKHGVEEAALERFANQYRGLSVKQSIKVSATNSSGQSQSAANVFIDGVARATVSVRIMNETVLAASLKVARAKLGLAPGRDPALAPHLKPDDGTTLSAEAVKAKELVARTVIDNIDVDKAFGAAFTKDSEGGPRVDPKAPSTEVWVSYLSAPQIGRAVLGKAGFDLLMKEFHEGDHAILVATRGRYGFQGPGQRPGAVPDQLSITQDGLPINVSDALAVRPPDSEALPKGLAWTVLKVIAEAGLDPSRPSQLAMRITRKNGEIYPRLEMREFPISFQAPPAYFSAAEIPLDGWRAVWFEQRYKIALTLAALLM
ncbi:MAG: 4Fe-4S binding protein, partial [Hyphomicrobium sp.]